MAFDLARERHLLLRPNGRESHRRPHRPPPASSAAPLREPRRPGQRNRRPLLDANDDGVDPADTSERNRTSETRATNLLSQGHPVRQPGAAPRRGRSRACRLDVRGPRLMTASMRPRGRGRATRVSGRMTPRSVLHLSRGLRVSGPIGSARRILMFHHFAGEPGRGRDCPAVHRLRLSRRPGQLEDRLARPSDRILHRLDHAERLPAARGRRRSRRSMPPLELAYSEAVIDETVHEIDAQSLENLPAGGRPASVGRSRRRRRGRHPHRAGRRLVLDKCNLSPAHEARGNGPIWLGPLAPVAARPALRLTGETQLLDLGGRRPAGRRAPRPGLRGFHERDPKAGWGPFRPFTDWPDVDPGDPNLRFVDLSGDGHGFIMIAADDTRRLASLPGRGRLRTGCHRCATPADEERGPRLVFADGEQSIYLADMSGDGLTDLVRIRNGEICYWPSLGHGRFGAKVTMADSPRFDRAERFDQRGASGSATWMAPARPTSSSAPTVSPSGAISPGERSAWPRRAAGARRLRRLYGDGPPRQRGRPAWCGPRPYPTLRRSPHALRRPHGRPETASPGSARSMVLYSPGSPPSPMCHGVRGAAIVDGRDRT